MVDSLANHKAPTLFEQKVCSPEQLVKKIALLPRPLVFTNGVFDILHRGHVTYLDQAAQLGKSLVVFINSDESVRRLNKGPDRPINGLEDRMSVLAALGSVSLVSYFETDTPLDAILMVKPDVLVKGGDWAVQNMVGAEEVQQWGGKVFSIPFEHQRSTTQLLNLIRA